MYEVIFTDFRIDSFGMLDVRCFMFYGYIMVGNDKIFKNQNINGLQSWHDDFKMFSMLEISICIHLHGM